MFYFSSSTCGKTCGKNKSRPVPCGLQEKKYFILPRLGTFVKLSRPDGRDSYISFPTEKLKVKLKKVSKRGSTHVLELGNIRSLN
jgi:hypothetical protein